MSRSTQMGRTYPQEPKHAGEASADAVTQTFLEIDSPLPVEIRQREKQEPTSDEVSEFRTLSQIRRMMKEEAEDYD